MSDFIQQQLPALLDSIIEPHSGQSLLALESVSDIQYAEGQLTLSVTLGYPCKEVEQELVETLQNRLQEIVEVTAVDVQFGWQAPSNLISKDQPATSRIRNIIAVASGKGGVGKSTTTANLALALAQLGAKVGVLDADIYGPSQATMLGIGVRQPEVRDQMTMLPHQSYGVSSMSMGYLVNEKTPMVWRGPMATGALKQLLFKTEWGQLDYLLIDMPPGTGDIQLTLSQSVPVSGAIVVTTPQDIALLDAGKAVEMFTKVNVPILGVVENMAVYQCSECGHKEHIFGAAGGGRIANHYQSTLLGALPLARSIREYADNGKPTVVAEPDSEIAKQYRDIAQKAAVELWVQFYQNTVPDIMVSDD
ncbi:ATP-binding protein [Candidatus Endobugula sertula]|uniref:Iron-sulfur cluster carrier protein n=1 Tax=Candidatus Endobugula sertula TaxID=62101 RepID=A0A1D2QP97_9GAMM|nr:ATP-binding protein [Candidatus Endobugula sertula]